MCQTHKKLLQAFPTFSLLKIKKKNFFKKQKTPNKEAIVEHEVSKNISCVVRVKKQQLILVKKKKLINQVSIDTW